MDPHFRRQLAFQAAALAERVRIKCGIRMNSAIDPLMMAESRDCEVRFLPLPSLEGVYNPEPGPVIILGSNRPAGRRAFTCAHELGHHEFKHGTRVEELNTTKSQDSTDPNEYLADMFAAFLLMSKICVRRAMIDRGLSSECLEPLQAFRMASFLGVGFSTLLDHLTWTLGLLNLQQREILLKTKPKDLKAMFGGSPQSEVVLVDEWWRDRAVDLEVGDILVLPIHATVEETNHLKPLGSTREESHFQAVSRGYLRAFQKGNSWAVNIRVAPKNYQGLARYRFYSDPEEAV